MRLLILLYTIFCGNKVGTDNFGNMYFISKYKFFAKNKRWVLYKGKLEASKIPDHWLMWLRHIIEFPQQKNELNVCSWQKLRAPNLTGTAYAFNPKDKSEDVRKKSASNYVAWDYKKIN